MFADLVGESCVRFEVLQDLRRPGAPPPPFVAAAYFWVTSPEALLAPRSPNMGPIYADIEKFSGTQPVRGWSEVA